MKQLKYRRCKYCKEWLYSYQGKRFCSRSHASLYQHSRRVGRPMERMEPVKSELVPVWNSTLGVAA
jgi:hypothetical protein